MVTNSNSAEYGRQPGGYFNIITKSGTNEVHGSGFFYFRDAAFNANEWQRNRSGLRSPPPTCGRLAAPPAACLQDKTFSSAPTSASLTRALLTSTIRYPSAKMIAGDFSEFQGQLYHPINQASDSQQPGAAGLVDPVAQKIAAELIPTVDRLGDRLVWDYTTPAENQEFSPRSTTTSAWRSA